MSKREPKRGGGPTESDRRTFLKRLAVAAPLGYTLSSTNAAACTPEEFADTPLAEEDAWRMVGYDPANTGFNPVATGPEPPVEVSWRVSNLPGNVWPPVVVGDTVYVGTGFFAPPGGDLRAFSTDRGTIEWLFVPSEPNVGVPAVVDGTIYIAGADGNVNAVDVETKELRWTFDTKGDSKFPKVADGTVYVAEQSVDFTVYAIDAEGGEEQWRFDAPTGTSFTVAVADGTVYVGPSQADTTLYALDATSGDEQWRFEAAAGPPGTPAVAHDIVYVGSDDSNVYAVDAATGEEQWRFEAATNSFGVPVVDDDTVYAPNDDTNLYAIDATTGEERWQFEAATGEIFAPAGGGETVYVGSRDTNVYAVDATSGDERWRFDAPTATEQWRFDHATEQMHSPAVVGETLYVPTLEGSLYAVM